MMRSIFAFIAFAVSLGIFFGYTRQTYDGLQGIQATIGQYDLALTRATELQKLKKDLDDRFDKISQTDKDRLHKLLPDHVDNVRLVLDIDSMASRHRMSMQNVVVNSSNNDNGKAPTIGGASSLSKSDSITLKFSTDGTYGDFMSFLQDLETSLRIVDVVNLSLTQAATEIGATEPMYHYDVTIRTYWLR